MGSDQRSKFRRVKLPGYEVGLMYPSGCTGRAMDSLSSRLWRVHVQHVKAPACTGEPPCSQRPGSVTFFFWPCPDWAGFLAGEPNIQTVMMCLHLQTSVPVRNATPFGNALAGTACNTATMHGSNNRVPPLF